MAFKTQMKPAGKLPQSEREAIVDLLHLCIYADAHISLKEGQVVSDVVDVIGWDTKLSFSAYEQRSIAAAREARSDEKSQKEFIESAAKRLSSKGSKDLAVSLCGELFRSDGTADREAKLLMQIRAILK
jgi:hypothetical protein